MRVTSFPPDPAAQSAALTQGLQRGLREVLQRLGAAATGGARPGLLAVSKSVPAATALQLARALAAAGEPVRLGENRIADLEAKVRAAADAGLAVEWHYIGHVQRNKARRIAAVADVIHSLDSRALADALERAAAELGRTLGVYVQVDFTPDAGKTGLDETGARELVQHLANCPHLALLGLMAMGPLESPPGPQTAAVFARVAALGRDLAADPGLAAVLRDGRAHLSLGMSADLELAVAAGSDLVRVGSDLFRHLEGPLAP